MLLLLATIIIILIILIIIIIIRYYYCITIIISIISIINIFIYYYRGVRYHLKEFGEGIDRPQNKEELFYLRHAKLRNIIERAFGVIKKRFPLLVNLKNYQFGFKCDLVMFLIHFTQFYSHAISI